MGIETVMITGDNLATATAIGKKLGIKKKIFAEVMPQDKEREVKKIQKVGKSGCDWWGTELMMLRHWLRLM